MENIDFASLILFVLITVYTPGPANITCASMGVRFGIKESLNFIYGATTGFLVVTLLGGFFSNILLTIMPSLESIMRWGGAAYILYLAYNILKSDYSYIQDDKQLQAKPFGFKDAIFLQLVNPKGIVFTITLYTAFLYPLIGKPLLILLFTIVLTIVGFGSYMLWTTLGAAISHFLNQEKIRKAVNLTLALLLVYTAIKLTGLINF